MTALPTVPQPLPLFLASFIIFSIASLSLKFGSIFDFGSWLHFWSLGGGGGSRGSRTHLPFFTRLALFFMHDVGRVPISTFWNAKERYFIVPGSIPSYLRGGIKTILIMSLFCRLLGLKSLRRKQAHLSIRPFQSTATSSLQQNVF